MVTSMQDATDAITIWRFDLDEDIVRALAEGIVTEELREHATQCVAEMNLELDQLIAAWKAKRDATTAKLEKENRKIRRDMERKTA